MDDDKVRVQHEKETNIVTALDRAIDNVTSSMLEKLASVKNRVANLEEQIKSRNEAIKQQNAELVRLIGKTNGETDSLHDSIDAVEKSIEAESRPS